MVRRISLIALALCLATTALAVAAEGTVNVNTAGSQELQLLPRVGPALSERIIQFREDNGPFASVDELVAVKGIGERTLEGMRPYVTVDGETTLTERVRVSRAVRDPGPTRVRAIV